MTTQTDLQTTATQNARPAIDLTVPLEPAYFNSPTAIVLATAILVATIERAFVELLWTALRVVRGRRK